MSLPIIDIADLTADNILKRQQVGKTLRTACLDSGFLYCTGHGVSDTLMRQVMQQMQLFFDQPLAAKMAIEKSQFACNRGYEVLGGQTLQQGGQPD